MIRSPEALALLLLVYTPFSAGFWSIISCRSAIDQLPVGRGLALFALIAIAPVLLIAETRRDPVPASSLLPPWAMAYLWLGAGLALGQQARTYLRRVGRSGYIFAACSVMVVVCLDGLAVDAPVEWIKTREFHPAATLFAWYGVFFWPALWVMLIMLGRNTTYRAMRAHARRLLKIFTVAGILEAALTYFAGYAGARLVWWVPHVEPPPVYEVVYLLIIALGCTLSVSDPVLAAAGWDAGSPDFDDETGLRIAEGQAGVSDDAEEKEGGKSKDDGRAEPLVRYTMPAGWRRIRSLPGAEAGRVMSWRIGPGTPVARLARAELGMQIRALPEQGAVREDALESWTEENFAIWGATPFRAARSTRHGFESYECEYFRPGGCGYLVWFMAFGYAVIFTWTTSSADVYKRYLKTVDEFIDACQISPPDASTKESA